MAISTKGSETQLVSNVGCYKVAPLGDGAVIMHQTNSELLFTTIAGDGRTVASFGQLIQDQRRYGIVLDGRIQGTAGIVIYVPNSLGFLAAFDADGHERYLINGIEEDGLPQINVLGTRVTLDRKPGSWWGRDLCIYDRLLVVLVGRTLPDREESGLDIYDTSTGKYSHSVRLPAGATGVAVLPDAVYTIESAGLAMRRLDWRNALAVR